MTKIAIIGLGYVGLPLALLASEKQHEVVGLDVSADRIAMLKRGESPIDGEDVEARLKKTNINFTDDFRELSDVEVAIICVPTPVDANKTPDISIVERASISAAKNLPKGSLLIIESTINPGVCDEVVIPAIESNTDHKIDETLYIAHCPERINPGDPKWHVGNINRVVGANCQKALDRAYDFYDSVIDGEIKKMNNIKEAEAVKIVENSFRDINIAFVNELAMSFNKLGIDTNNVIDGAATKPFSFMAHYPGIGVGGHCIPVDPYYLIEYAKSKGFEHRFMSLARSINENMPSYAVGVVEKAVSSSRGCNLDGLKVMVLGLSYKKDVADDRESPAYAVIKLLKAKGCIVSAYDPFITNQLSEDSLDDALKGKDVIILVTDHSEFKNLQPSKIDKGAIFFDGRNVLASKRELFTEAGVDYLSIS